MDNNKWLTAAVAALGVGLVYNYMWTSKVSSNAYDDAQSGNVQSTLYYSLNMISPVATVAAPRKYVSHNPGSGPPGNPGESWRQGGGASITNTTGRWAA